jgi:hypothetical protein
LEEETKTPTRHKFHPKEELRELLESTYLSG